MPFLPHVHTHLLCLHLFHVGCHCAILPPHLCLLLPHTFPLPPATFARPVNTPLAFAHAFSTLHAFWFNFLRMPTSLALRSLVPVFVSARVLLRRYAAAPYGCVYRHHSLLSASRSTRSRSTCCALYTNFHFLRSLLLYCLVHPSGLCLHFVSTSRNAPFWFVTLLLPTGHYARYPRVFLYSPRAFAPAAHTAAQQRVSFLLHRLRSSARTHTPARVRCRYQFYASGSDFHRTAVIPTTRRAACRRSTAPQLLNIFLW